MLVFCPLKYVFCGKPSSGVQRKIYSRMMQVGRVEDIIIEVIPTRIITIFVMRTQKLVLIEDCLRFAYSRFLCTQIVNSLVTNCFIT